MYRPKHFRLDDADRILALLRARPLATLIALDAAGAPTATPVPVVTDRCANGTLRLRFHLARGNPITDQIAGGSEALLSFVGADGYVSPDWYETRHLPPTWNYETIQVRGPADEVEDASLRELVADLAALEEARLAPKPPWTDAKMGEARLASMLRAIRGFTLTPASVEAKAKLSQNRSPADRAGVVAALEASGTERATALARAMRAANPEEDGSR